MKSLRKTVGWFGDHAVWFAAGTVMLLLCIPVVYTAVFSFNAYHRSNLVWNPEGSPTLAHWADPCGAAGICDALATSLRVGLISTVIATVLGTLMAVALVRTRLRGRGALEVLLLLPMDTPDVVLGAGLLTLFVQGLSAVGLRLGETAIIAAHVMLALSFVVVAVRSRLESLDPRLAEAAADLYAGTFATFRHVTLPLAAPGIVGAALLAFAISMDDVVLATFVGGDAMTFPRYVYVTALRGIPAQANVIGVGLALLGLSAALAFTAASWLRRRRRTVR
ncbi:spermidine/putrescine transport system permease protein [Austwickia chelonae]|uniref:Putative ABC transporter permease protein n=1 Tax=Austwickia chelonae NBRC 105200 TaxID=1184607 RepID=K6VIJ5_9MICO|nr:ABC transporter permease [Austwickia chelonae]GAB76534.1 putative ABC transporter permease protein [Austwickia chelonae NBRC 105200]SEW26341.1 spermidine/putrescine transport system permease protein [Austwickia chelonae]